MLPLLLKFFGYKDILAVALKILVSLYHGNQSKIVEAFLRAIPNSYQQKATIDEVTELMNSLERLLSSDEMQDVMVKLKSVLN